MPASDALTARPLIPMSGGMDGSPSPRLSSAGADALDADAAAPLTPDLLKTLDADGLRAACARLRAELIDTVSRTGGHLGASLGVVELTVALHRAYTTPEDALVFDVGHQCYPHKMLTGRGAAMATLRKEGGLSGFTNRAESPHDSFGAGHSSTSVSAGLGLAVARRLRGDPSRVAAVLGDGAASAGLVFEGLNNLGATGAPLTVILNDNQMSISPPAGALSDYLAGLGAKLAPKAARAAALAEGRLQSHADAPTLFDDLAVPYCGPYDGHDVEEMARVLELARAHDGPLLLHVLTVKGKGFAPAEASADCYHGVGAFDAATGAKAPAAVTPPKYQDAYGRELIRLAEADPRIVSITPAMLGGSGLDAFHARFPERSFDVGIAEQHAVTFAAGLAADGMRPFCAVYSTFLQRGFDQVVHDVAIQGLPVRFAIDRAGFVGADGLTHQGAYDLVYLCCLPGMSVLAPSDEAELAAMMSALAVHDSGPSAIRYPRGPGTGVSVPDAAEPVEWGRGRVLQEGEGVALLSLGAMLGPCRDAAKLLSRHAWAPTLADARFAKPVDRDLVERLARAHDVLVTVEEGAQGGFGPQVGEALRQLGLAGRVRHLPIAMADAYVDHGSRPWQLAQAGLSADRIAQRVLDAVRAG